MSANEDTGSYQRKMSDPPDSPVERVEVEHADGTVRYLEGEDVHLWVQYVGNALEFADEYGGRPPEVEWKEKENGNE